MCLKKIVTKKWCTHFSHIYAQKMYTRSYDRTVLDDFDKT